MNAAPDFSQPGGDGALPQGFKEWQWGVAYTVGPHMLLPLLPGGEYKIFAAVRRRISTVGEFTGIRRTLQESQGHC